MLWISSVIHVHIANSCFDVCTFWEMEAVYGVFVLLRSECFPFPCASLSLKILHYHNYTWYFKCIHSDANLKCAINIRIWNHNSMNFK